MYKALNTFEELKNLDGQYDCLKNLGIIYENQSAYDKALECYQRSLVIVMKINDTLKLAKSLGNIGNLYETVHNYPKALEYSRKALQLTEKLKNISGRATCLGNIGVVYADMKQYDSALSFYNQALKLFEDVADNAGIAINLGNIGDIYYSSAKDAQDDTGGKSKESISQNTNLQLAVEYFNKAIAISKSIDQNETTMSFMESLSDAYRLEKNYPAAYETYKQYANLKDSVSGRENRAQLATIEKERELELKDHQLKIDQLRKQYIVGLFVVALLVVMGIVVNKFIKQKRSNKILAEEKKENLKRIELQTKHIVAQKDVLTDIAHIQSHDVRGPLATILGLVQLFNFENAADSDNKVIITAIAQASEQLDTVIKEVVYKENNLRRTTSEPE